MGDRGAQAAVRQRRRRAPRARPAYLLAAACVAAIALPASARAAACSDEYTGPSGGSWSEASSWSAGLPGPASVVCWSASSTVVVDEGAEQAASVSAGGSLIVSGDGSLDLLGEGSSALSGELETREHATLRLAAALACGGVRLEGGTLQLDGSIGCPIAVERDGRLTGSGTAAAQVLNEGLLEPGDPLVPGDPLAPGDLRVQGAYTQGSGGLLTARAGGPSVAGADGLAVAGSVRLAGAVSLQLAFTGAAGESFPVIQSPAPPQGAFSTLGGSTGGSPWTVEYGQAGVIATYASAPLLHPLIEGRLEVGRTVRCGLGPWTPDPASIAYSWEPPFRAEVLEKALAPFGEPLPAEAELEDALRSARGPQLLVPGAVLGERISCSASAQIPLAGSDSTALLEERQRSEAVGFLSPVHNETPPKIIGTPVPGRTLRCTFGNWSGPLTGYSWRWSGGAGQSRSATYLVSSADEGARLRCTLYAGVGATAVPASSAARLVPYRPQATLCPRRQLALVSVRRAARKVLLFGAATAGHIGERVLALGPGARAVGRVGGEGYFELSLPRRGSGAGTYTLRLGSTRSNALRLPGLLEIVSDRTERGSAEVLLRLSRAAPRAGVIVLSRMAGCSPGERVASARVAPGATAAFHLIARRGPRPSLFLARVTSGGASHSLELLVPPRRQLRR